jgi:peptidoglycan hydrolase CwlO-like protein
MKNIKIVILISLVVLFNPVIAMQPAGPSRSQEGQSGVQTLEQKMQKFESEKTSIVQTLQGIQDRIKQLDDQIKGLMRQFEANQRDEIAAIEAVGQRLRR